MFGAIIFFAGGYAWHKYGVTQKIVAWLAEQADETK